MGTKGVHCVGCTAKGTVWCKNCQNQAVRIEPPFCKRCGYPSEKTICKWCRYKTPSFNEARSWARYSGELRAALLHLKVKKDFDLASALALNLQSVFSVSWRVDLVVPIPLSTSRLRIRGFNQAALLAEAFTSLVNLPLAIQALVRIRDTHFQRMGMRQERERNLTNAFKAEKGSFLGMRILVVDDIFVTGATINSASKTIKAAGGQSVFAITVARSLLNRPA